MKEIRSQRDAAHDALKESGAGTEAKHNAVDDAAIEKAQDADYNVKSDGDSIYIEELDTTIHRELNKHKSPTGSSAAEAEAAGGYGREASRSIKSQNKAVEVMDNLGKSDHTMYKPTDTMTSDDWQKLGKMTGRNIDAAGIENPDLADKYRKLKDGLRPESIGIKDLDEFHQQCKEANTEAGRKVRTEAKVKEKRLEKNLEQAKKDIKEAEKTGNRKKLRKATNKTR